MEIIIIGILLIALSIYLIFFLRSKNANELMEIQFQPTKTIPEVKEAIEAMADIDPGYREIVEVKGFAQPSVSMVTPFTNKQVAFYVAMTYNIYETTERYRDSNGFSHTRVQKHKDLINQTVSGAELLLKDSSGNELIVETIDVLDKIDLIKACDKFEPKGIGLYGSGNSGYQKEEYIIPLNAPLYVLGEAYSSNGKLYVGQPIDGKKPYIVSTKSEEKLVAEKSKNEKWSFYGGILSAAIGVIILIIGLVQ